jgi:hypothetical protein
MSVSCGCDFGDYEWWYYPPEENIQNFKDWI